MKTANAIDTGATKIVPIKNIKPSKAKMTMCPAIMLAKSRIANANGFVNNPSISTNTINGNRTTGIPCGTNPLKYPKNPFCLIPPNCIIINDIIARVAVTAMLLVKVAE